MKIEELTEILKSEIVISEIENGIFSVIDEEKRKHDYDNKAAFYDKLVGNSLYNKVIWKNEIANYSNFCQKGISSRKTGWILDAGCGSLLFTAQNYKSEKNRPIVLVDRSIEMLKKGKSRLINSHGNLPENVVLMQADISNLPFQSAVFETVLSFGMIHLFEDTKSFLDSILNVKSENGSLFFTSLVSNNFLGKIVLNILKQKGEVGFVNSTSQITARLENLNYNFQQSTIGNFAYFSKN